MTDEGRRAETLPSPPLEAVVAASSRTEPMEDENAIVTHKPDGSIDVELHNPTHVERAVSSSMLIDHGRRMDSEIPLAVHLGRSASPLEKVEIEESERTLECVMCHVPVLIASATTKHPEAPDMLQPEPGAWIGSTLAIQENEDGSKAIDIVVVCSKKCRDQLLSE